MKRKENLKAVILTALLILLLNQARADIIIEPWEKEAYNLGETVKLAGYVLPDEDFRGRFRVKLVCQEEENELLVKLYDFEKGKKLFFNESLFILASKAGNCFFAVALDDLKEVKETEESSLLAVSDKLILEVSLDKNNIQLGEKINLKGTAKNLAHHPVGGLVTIRIAKGAETFMTTSSEIDGGKFNSSLGPIFMLSGEYQINAGARDIFGNQAEKNFGLNVTSQIKLKAVADKTKVYPGETIYLSGKISYSLSEPKTGSEFKILFAGEEHRFPQLENVFSFDLPVKKDQKAGKEILKMAVADAFGNKGEEEIEIVIQQKPSSLELSLDKKEVKPEENLTFSGKLLDQAGELIPEEIVLELYQDKKLLWQNITQPNQERKYSIPKYTRPKMIILTAKYQDLITKKEITVLEVRMIQSYLEDSQIVIENAGNVRYQEILDFTLIGDKKYVLNKEIDLSPGEKVKFDFNQDLPANNYTLIVPSGPAIYNISIIKKEISEGLAGANEGMTREISKIRKNIFYILALILALLVLTLYFYYYHLRHSSKIRKLLGIKIDGFQKKVDHYKSETFFHKQKAEAFKGEKEKLHDLFNKFADKEIVNEIINQPNLTGGEEREITVMFADLCNFTQLCEKSQLSSIREILNDYFESMYLIVKKNRGVVNEYLGDALFILFNAPNRINNHPLVAVKTALAMKEELKRLNPKLVQKGYPPLEIGIGINTGKAKIGILGVNRLKYAALGDTVNTASRLENESKAGEILISQEVYDQIKNEVNVQSLGLIKVKHKEMPLKAYKVLGLKSSLSELRFPRT